MSPPEMQRYLQLTSFVDANHTEVRAFSERATRDAVTPEERAVRLYYAVRDGVRYDPYACSPDEASLRASRVLTERRGYCVSKAVLLAACGRAVGVPTRLGFADVRNHLTTPRLRDLMGTDVFYYHGFTEFWLEGRWVKATPAFNRELCQRFGVRPLEFNGVEDAVFHEYDTRGQRHMEYVAYHEPAADVPLDRILGCYRERYPRLFELTARTLDEQRARDGAWRGQS